MGYSVMDNMKILNVMESAETNIAKLTQTNRTPCQLTINDSIVGKRVLSYWENRGMSS